MAKAVVVEVRCDRCKRKEYKEYPTLNDAQTEEAPVLYIGGSLTPPGLPTREKGLAELKDLCEPCKKTVSKYLEQIFKPMNSKSPKREKRAKKKGPVADPPSPPS